MLSTVCLLAGVLAAAASAENEAGRLNEPSNRRVLQTNFGDLHIALYDNAAPKTTSNVAKLLDLGLYNTNHFFRVDKGFVAQVAGIEGNLLYSMNDEQRLYAGNTVPLEVHENLKHDRAGLLSLARHDDPNSGGSSFSVMLGPAPHLDMNYAIFGEVTHGIETLRAMEEVETTREGIFVMPVERITIHSTYTYNDGGGGDGGDGGGEAAGSTTTTSSKGAVVGAEVGTKTQEETGGPKQGSRAMCSAHVLAALKAVRQRLV